VPVLLLLVEHEHDPSPWVIAQEFGGSLRDRQLIDLLKGLLWLGLWSKVQRADVVLDLDDVELSECFLAELFELCFSKLVGRSFRLDQKKVTFELVDDVVFGNCT
jgi:hypothetical protein